MLFDSCWCTKTCVERNSSDILLVPGGQGTRKEVDNTVLVDFISKQARECKVVISVCTGVFLLHKARLLSGRKVTTHRGSINRLRELGEITVVQERFVRDREIWTSAGVSAGIDLMLALIAEIAGEEAAEKVQLAAEYYPSTRRYGSLRRIPGVPQYLKEKV